MTIKVKVLLNLYSEEPKFLRDLTCVAKLEAPSKPNNYKKQCTDSEEVMLPTNQEPNNSPDDNRRIADS